MGRYRSSITPKKTFVGGTQTVLVRANPQRCAIIIPPLAGVSMTLDWAEVGFGDSAFTWAQTTSPTVLHESTWGDLVERAITVTFSLNTTISIIEVLDMEKRQ